VNVSQRMMLGVAAAGVGVAVAVSAAPGSQSRSLAGGTYRVGVESFYGSAFPWGGGLDPTGEFDTAARAIYTNLLVRTLVGTNHVAGKAGSNLVPDLAVSVPAPTNRGTTYTFRLKRGIRFGPPVNREITAGDIRYAVERLARPRNVSVYASAFDDIQGFGAYRRGKATSISGIVTPNAKTITFKLTRPAGDFLSRMTLSAAGPIPPEVGRCFEGKPGGYGRDVIASGPYMIEGSSEVKVGPCREVRPMRGASDTQLTLVRNPSYDARTDSKAARENNPDRFAFVVTGKAVEIVNKLNAGELEDALFFSGPKVIGKYAANARRRGLLRVNSADSVHYLAMNLTQPPFDDVHVRRAMTWVMDKAALRDAWGGPLAGRIPQHIAPDGVLDDQLAGYAPFKTAGDHGDLARAKSELAKSKYATRNGVCIAKACKRVHLFSGLALSPISYAPGERMKPIITATAAKLGITFILRGRKADRPSSNNPFLANVEWPKHLPDPSNYFDPLLAGAAIVPSGNLNYSLVGITPAQAARLGVKGNVKGVPSMDADLARCSSVTGTGRVDCYARLDRKLSTEVVAWIPFLWRNRITILGPQVARWAFDQSIGTTAYAHVAVKR
jgi:peptide/nickel transport system substrate-binding protein